MLRSLKDLELYTATATDGDIGSVVNFLLDDERWIVRYLVVQTNGLFEGHEVLISPISFRHVDWSTRQFHLALTKDKVQKSRSFEVNVPISREHERGYYHYYGYSPYWGQSGLWGTGAYPGNLATDLRDEASDVRAADGSDIHLRSAKDICGYHIQGTDDAIGHVDDFIVDDESWEIRYLVVDTSNWWFGKKVLVAPHWASRISWDEGKVHVDLSRLAIKNCPEWDAAAPVNREYEVRLYDYYGRPVYWDGGNQRVGTPVPFHSGSATG